jgi:hypothetical protein
MPAPPETDLAKIRKYCQTRVPARLRDQVWIEASVRGGSVETDVWQLPASAREREAPLLHRIRRGTGFSLGPLFDHREPSRVT